jgi:NAD(P)-dependent dehydrogenase (short-subunit alcohol dehydrogenase family)
MSLLSGDAILLAGGTGRVASATIRTLVAHGANVVVVSRRGAVAQRAIDSQLAAADREHAVAFEADLTAPEDGANAVAHVVRRFGRIDALISLAGGGSAFVPIAQSTPEDIAASLRNNLTVAYNLALPALTAMLTQAPREGRRSRGRILAVTAGSSLTPQPRFGVMGIGKAGVNVLMLAIAREHKADGIVANAVILGGVAIDAAREYMSGDDFAAAVTPQEVADVLAFHASDASTGVNGALIHTNGREVD